jgi:hypothetical protein
MTVFRSIFLGKNTINDADIRENITIERVHIMVKPESNKMHIPILETGHGETRYTFLRIIHPPKESYNFRMLTNIHSSNIDVYGCYDDLRQSNLHCTSLKSQFGRLPIPTNNDWKIKFRQFDSPPSENRPEWTNMDINLDSLVDFKGIVIKVHPNSNGFLYTEIGNPKRSNARLDVSLFCCFII